MLVSITDIDKKHWATYVQHDYKEGAIKMVEYLHGLIFNIKGKEQILQHPDMHLLEHKQCREGGGGGL